MVGPAAPAGCDQPSRRHFENRLPSSSTRLQGRCRDGRKPTGSLDLKSDRYVARQSLRDRAVLLGVLGSLAEFLVTEAGYLT